MPPRPGLQVYVYEDGSISIDQEDIDNGNESSVWLQPEQARQLADWLEQILEEQDACCAVG